MYTICSILPEFSVYLSIWWSAPWSRCALPFRLQVDARALGVVCVPVQVLLGLSHADAPADNWQAITRNLSYAHEMRKSLQQFRFSSLAENWGVHAKLIYKYQILYLDCITIVPWRHLVNDIDLCRSPKSPITSIKPPILAFKVIQDHWIWRQSRASVRLSISD